MSMIKRANGQIKTFTDEQGKEVEAKVDVVWADEKEQKPVIKDALDVDVIADISLDINASDESEDVVAKDC
jgi:hypothetical protein